mmetsp:Transcript_6196/g.20085  ORF Transcript_6196/g.20085 Transcript_6196/m.20085 type:complete len:396 (-) Transcript_6196:333-1520(-)
MFLDLLGQRLRHELPARKLANLLEESGKIYHVVRKRPVKVVQGVIDCARFRNAVKQLAGSRIRGNNGFVQVELSQRARSVLLLVLVLGKPGFELGLCRLELHDGRLKLCVLLLELNEALLEPPVTLVELALDDELLAELAFHLVPEATKLFLKPNLQCLPSCFRLSSLTFRQCGPLSFPGLPDRCSTAFRECSAPTARARPARSCLCRIRRRRWRSSLDRVRGLRERPVRRRWPRGWRARLRCTGASRQGWGRRGRRRAATVHWRIEAELHGARFYRALKARSARVPLVVVGQKHFAVRCNMTVGAVDLHGAVRGHVCQRRCEWVVFRDPERHGNVVLYALILDWHHTFEQNKHGARAIIIKVVLGLWPERPPPIQRGNNVFRDPVLKRVLVVRA